MIMTKAEYRLVSTDDNWSLIEACQKNNRAEWGGGLTETQYLVREKGVHVRYTTEQNRITHWALQERADSTGTGSSDTTDEWKTVSAFETVRRPAYLTQKGQPGVEIWSHSIGSVFTPPENRGKGYAREMITRGTNKLLQWQLDGLSPELQKKTLLALWSDVGRYYEKFGYKMWDLSTVTIQADDVSKQGQLVENAGYTQSIDTNNWPIGVKPVVSESQIARFIIAEQDFIKREMEAATELDGKSRVVLMPTPSMIQQLNWRAVYSGKYLGRLRTEATVFGAFTEKSWVLWYQTYVDDKLQVLRMHSECETVDATLKDVALLMQAAICESRKWGLPQVCLWKDDLPASLNETGLPASRLDNSGIDSDKLEKYLHKALNVPVKIEPRKGSWPMSYVDDDRKDVEWVFRGKYCWW